MRFSARLSLMGLSLGLFLSLEEPMDPKFIGQVPIAAKRQVAQIVQECFICSWGELVEDRSQLAVPAAVDVHADHIALFGHSRRVHPVGGRKLDGTALQMSIDDQVVFLRRDLSFHGRVADLYQG